MIKEESDYHDLESVVQQVEQNLELMTVCTGVAPPGVKGRGCWEALGVSLRWTCAPPQEVPEAISEQGPSQWPWDGRWAGLLRSGLGATG